MAEETGPPAESAGGRGTRPPRKRRLIMTRGAPAAIGALVLAVFLSPLLLLGHEVSAPSWLARKVEASAARALDGGAIAMEEMVLILGTDLHPRVRLRGAELSDAGGRELARVPEIDMLFSPRGLVLRRELLVQEVVLTGAALQLDRDAEGRLELAFGGEASFGAGGRTPASAALPGAGEGLTGLLTAFDALFDRPALEALERVRAEGLVVNYQDDRAGRNWVVDGGRLSLDLRAGETRLTGDLALLSGRSYVSTLELSYRSRRGTPEAELVLEARDVSARDIATQSPALAWLGLLDAPISARLAGSVTADGALGALAAELDIAEGLLRPDPAAPGIPFESARAALAFDPAAGELRFDEIALTSRWGTLAASGETWLQGMDGGLPTALTGQIRLAPSTLGPGGPLPAPLAVAEAHATFRLGLAPFRLEVAEAGVTLGAVAGADGSAAEDPIRLTGSGEVAVTREGWQVSADATSAGAEIASLLALWPEAMKPKTRLWLAENVAEARFTGIAAGLALRPGAPSAWQVTTGFEGASIRPLRRLPPITGGAGSLSFDGQRLTVLLEEGEVSPPLGGRLDMAGTVFSIPDVRIREAPAEVRLAAAGSITAGLSLLDLPPFEFMTKANRPVTLADGRARAWGVIRLPLKARIGPGEARFEIEAALTDVVSSAVVEGQELRAAALSLTVTGEALTIAGPARLGPAAADFTWRLPLGPRESRPPATLVADVALSPQALEAFGIVLPPGTMTGAGQGRLEMTFALGAAPRYRLTSDLAGIGLRVPQIGWSKPAGARGDFSVEGQIGPAPTVEAISLSAAGLTAEGSIRLAAGGGLERARLTRLSIGDWLDAPVDITGRGPGAAPAITLRGGRLDLGQASFGGGGGGGAGPLEVTLDRLEVTEGIALTGFRGSFSGALQGRFTARVNGGQEVTGATEPTEAGLAVRILSPDAGAVMRDLALIDTARGGALDLVLQPRGERGTYDGQLAITDLRVQDAPAMAALLDAVSIVGAFQQLDGQGLSFTELDATFTLAPGLITIRQASAIGPSLGISLDGYYTTAGKIMDFQGVVSPFYFINGIGSLLTRPGEGLIGFNFTLAGPASDPAVQVNPLSAFTPGMFREIFRRPAPGAE
ncbi:AsmA-like C-terminal region-containing protein [Pseudoroseicyclus sp. CXY001]|uniref:AsmA-like C-terminal region-containing protein n=1 Tax=Pseudoroseicyclus sp. CXY001 TaxID=3242492 RepID=UPI00358DBB81